MIPMGDMPHQHAPADFKLNSLFQLESTDDPVTASPESMVIVIVKTEMHLPPPGRSPVPGPAFNLNCITGLALGNGHTTTVS